MLCLEVCPLWSARFHCTLKIFLQRGVATEHAHWFHPSMFSFRHSELLPPTTPLAIALWLKWCPEIWRTVTTRLKTKCQISSDRHHYCEFLLHYVQTHQSAHISIKVKLWIPLAYVQTHQSAQISTKVKSNFYCESLLHYVQTRQSAQISTRVKSNFYLMLSKKSRMNRNFHCWRIYSPAQGVDSGGWQVCKHRRLSRWLPASMCNQSN